MFLTILTNIKQTVLLNLKNPSILKLFAYTDKTKKISDQIKKKE